MNPLTCAWFNCVSVNTAPAGTSVNTWLSSTFPFKAFVTTLLRTALLDVVLSAVSIVIVDPPPPPEADNDPDIVKYHYRLN